MKGRGGYMASNFFNRENIRVFLRRIGFNEEEIGILMEQIEFFDAEAPERDNIVREYLGEACIEEVVEEIVGSIDIHMKKKRLSILDVGAGSGTFTRRIRDRLIDIGFDVDVYGLDISPKMLRKLGEKGVKPVWGSADRILESIKLNNELFKMDIPTRFDVVVSTLALHHFRDPHRVLRSIGDVLSEDGVAVIVDVLKHGHDMLIHKLRDLHPGFTVDTIKTIASDVFGYVETGVLHDVYCTVYGYKVGMFKAVMVKHGIA